MANSYADFLSSTETVSGSGSTFNGRNVTFNADGGEFSLTSPSADFETGEGVEAITDVRFAFRALRNVLRIQIGDNSVRTQYVDPSADKAYRQYVATIGDKYVIGSTKKEFLENAAQQGLQLNPVDVKQQRVFFGFLVNLNGQPAQHTELIRYVNRGVQYSAMLDAERAQNINGYKGADLIEIQPGGQDFVTNRGKHIKTLAFTFSELSPDKFDGFVKYIGDANTELEKYLDEVDAETKSTIDAVQKGEQPVAAQGQAPVQGQPQANPFAQPAQQAPQADPFTAPANVRAQAEQQQTTNPFAAGAGVSQPAPQQAPVQTAPAQSAQPVEQPAQITDPAQSAQPVEQPAQITDPSDITIDDDDLPF